jgi:hypothetical protein
MPRKRPNERPAWASRGDPLLELNPKWQIVESGEPERGEPVDPADIDTYRAVRRVEGTNIDVGDILRIVHADEAFAAFILTPNPDNVRPNADYRVAMSVLRAAIDRGDFVEVPR